MPPRSSGCYCERCRRRLGGIYFFATQCSFNLGSRARPTSAMYRVLVNFV